MKQTWKEDSTLGRMWPMTKPTAFSEQRKVLVESALGEVKVGTADVGAVHAVGVGALNIAGVRIVGVGTASCRSFVV